MQKRNLWVVAAIVVLIAAVGAAGFLMRPKIPAADAPAVDGAAGTFALTDGAASYAVITANGVTYAPVPLLNEKDYGVRNGENVNVIRVTQEGVHMQFSTCDNQDCVLQGEVTLQNRSTRVLGNMIVCLPNQVVVELYSAEEIAKMMAD